MPSQNLHSELKRFLNAKNQSFSPTSEVAKALAHGFEIRLSSGYHVPQSGKDLPHAGKGKGPC